MAAIPIFGLGHLPRDHSSVDVWVCHAAGDCFLKRKDQVSFGLPDVVGEFVGSSDQQSYWSRPVEQSPYGRGVSFFSKLQKAAHGLVRPFFLGMLFPLTSSPAMNGRDSYGVPAGFAGISGFLPQPPYFSGELRRGFTFGLSARRSFGRSEEH